MLVSGLDRIQIMIWNNAKMYIFFASLHVNKRWLCKMKHFKIGIY